MFIGVISDSQLSRTIFAPTPSCAITLGTASMVIARDYTSYVGLYYRARRVAFSRGANPQLPPFIITPTS